MLAASLASQSTTPAIFAGGVQLEKSASGIAARLAGVSMVEGTTACTRMVGFHLVESAGHWVQQEQPQQVSRLLIQFLRDNGAR